MAKRRSRRARPAGGSGLGLPVDYAGLPAIDPTANVTAQLDAAVARLDDLREASEQRTAELVAAHTEMDRQTARHIMETAELRARYEEMLRTAERDRIDAIRALDVSNVERAQAVSQEQAATLATQVATSAEALRAQVEATRVQTAIALDAALQPIKFDVSDLRRVQYEQQGQRAAVTETKSNTASLWAVLIGAGGFLIGLSGLVLAFTRGG